MVSPSPLKNCERVSISVTPSSARTTNLTKFMLDRPAVSVRSEFMVSPPLYWVSFANHPIKSFPSTAGGAGSTSLSPL